MRQLESLIRLSEARARIDCSHVIEPKHVHEAVRLLRKSIIHVETEDVLYVLWHTIEPCCCHRFGCRLADDDEEVPMEQGDDNDDNDDDNDDNDDDEGKKKGSKVPISIFRGIHPLLLCSVDLNALRPLHPGR